MKNVFTVLVFTGGFILLSWLCVWQIQRLEWKNEILQRMEEEIAKAPSAQDLNLEDLPAENEVEAATLYFRSGTIEGRIFSEEPLYFRRTRDGVFGFELMMPVTVSAEEESALILVNLGWMPENPATHAPMMPLLLRNSAEIRAAGLVRPFGSNPFALANDPDANRWSTYDPAAKRTALGFDGTGIPPVQMLATDLDVPFELPSALEPPDMSWRPNNRHAQYALFWGAMALLWAGIFGASLLKRRNDPSDDG